MTPLEISVNQRLETSLLWRTEGNMNLLKIGISIQPEKKKRSKTILLKRAMVIS